MIFTEKNCYIITYHHDNLFTVDVQRYISEKGFIAIFKLLNSIFPTMLDIKLYNLLPISFIYCLYSV